MAASARRLLLLLLAAAAFAARAQDDFDLQDALGEDTYTKAPKKPPPATGDDLDLTHALGGHDEPAAPSQPRPRPPPNNPGHSDKGISDSDLIDVNPGGSGGRRGGGGGGGSGPSGPMSDEPEGTPEGVIPAIVSSVAVALAGVVSGFVAYYKKKLCFKQSGQQGDVEMAGRAEQPVQQTLLER